MLFNWHHFPFVRLFLPLATGILAAAYIPLHLDLLLVLSIGAGLLFLVISLPEPVHGQPRYRWLFGGLLSAFLLLTGILLYHRQHKVTTIPDLSHTEYILAEVTEEPVRKTNSYKTEFKLVKAVIGNDTITINKGAIVYSPLSFAHTGLIYGDRVMLRGRFEIPGNAANPFQFNYKHYLAQNGIFYQAYLGSEQLLVLDNHPPFTLQRWVHSLRRNVVNTFDKLHLGKEELGVASALIIGYKEELGSDVKASYSRAGAIHVLAVSGLHVGIIFIMISRFLFFLKEKSWHKWMKFLIIFLFLWFYALLSGFSPSVLRATVMFSFILPATIWKLPSNIYNTIALSAFFLLLFDPDILFDVGFQLSYIAVTGIIYLHPKMKYWFVSRHKILNAIWSLTAVSLAAQLATMPLTLYYFGQFPNYFLIGNLLIVPFAGILVYLGIACIVFSFIPVVSDLLGYSLHYAIRGMNTVIFTIEKLPFSYADNLPLHAGQMLLIYGVMITGICFFERRKKIYLTTSLVLIISILVTILIRQAEIRKQHFLVMYNMNKTSYLELVKNRTAYSLPSDNIPAMNYGLFVRPFHQARGISRNLQLPAAGFYVNGPVVGTGKHSIFIYDTSGAEITYRPLLEFDYVWVRYTGSRQPVDILSGIACKQVILDNRLKHYHEKQWIAACDSLQIPYYSMREKGAFILKWD